MPTGPVSARVFIWYPKGGDIGHAAMYLGNYEIGRKFEMSLDPNNLDAFVMTSALEHAMGADGIHYNDNYVSWWPDRYAGAFTPQQSVEAAHGLYHDVREEGSEPHVAYDLYGLDVARMRARWRETRDKPGAHYNLYRKNCADLVLRVLVAGGALAKLDTAKAAWFGHNLISTPKKVAQLCNELRDAGWATKSKAGNCPSRMSVFVVAGLR